MRSGVRILAVCTGVAAAVAPLVLAGCAPQADWDGAKKLASQECVLAAQLFSAPGPSAPGPSAPGPSATASTAELAEDGGDAPEPPPTRAELADSLRQYVPEDLHEVLDIYALLEPVMIGDESDERQAQIAEVLSARSLAEDALRGWAQIACGPEVGQLAGAAEGESSEWPTLSQLHALEGELDGVRIVSVAGAVEPDHAVALCEEVRRSDAEAQIEVTDSDGFPLALALPDAACGYDPILFEGLEPE